MGRSVLRALAFVAVLGCTIAAASPAGAAEVTVVRKYVAASTVQVNGSTVAEQQFCVRMIARDVLPDSNVPDVGGACLSDAVPFPPPYDTVDLRVADNVVAHVLARYTFTDVDFEPLGVGLFCDATAGVEIPDGAWHIDVAVIADLGGTHGCGKFSPVAGKISARFATVAFS